MKQDDFSKKSTHFGFETINTDDKQSRVGDVFDSVANKYDLMNDLMSFGIHRLWKQFTIQLATIKPDMQILDLAGGTGDLAKLMVKKINGKGLITIADINANMLDVGRRRLIDLGIIHNVEYVQANAEHLPFTNNHFDLITMAFGLRNVTDKSRALASMYQCLKPGGKIMILEFSKPNLPLLAPLYDMYSFSILPKLGELFAGDKNSYQYLAESIRMHPDQETLKSMVNKVGFEDCKYYNLTGGITALHVAYKY